MEMISVVVPSYNHPETIERCVHSILKQDFKGDYEIVIVDSSVPKTQDVVEQICNAHPNIRLIKLSKQTFPGAARNIGIEAAKGTIIALIDSDCVANENWLSTISKIKDDNTIYTGIIKNGTPKSPNGTSSFLIEFNAYLHLKPEEREIELAATCNFVCKKVVFEKVGYFSDDRAFEDMLFCMNHNALGGKVVQLKQLSITHINKTKLADVVRNQKMLGKMSAIVRRKNKLPPHLIFKFPLLSFALIGYRYWSILFRVIGTKHIWKYLLYSPLIIYILTRWAHGFYLGSKAKLDGTITN